MECHNSILEQVKRRKISVEDKINMEDLNNILQKLKRLWIYIELALKDASKDLKRDREIVMTALNQNW